MKSMEFTPEQEIVYASVGGKSVVWKATKRPIGKGELKVGTRYRVWPNGEVEPVPEKFGQ